MLLQRNFTQLKLFLTLIFGIALGLIISQVLYSTNCTHLQIQTTLWTSARGRTYSPEQHDDYYAERVKDLLAPDSEIPNATWPISDSNLSDYKSLADKLYNETRVLCWVLTSPNNHAKRAVHVKNTWGSRCNKLIFMSSAEDSELGAVKLSVGEGRGNLWRKTREAAKYIYDHHLDEADWFLKADDDTYVIVENLRAFLYQFSSESPVYFGCKFKPHVRQGYMSGGAGYALSKEALRRFVNKAYPNSKICRQRSGGSEDKEMGYCLQNVGVVAGDSRDEQKRGRFFPSGPQGHLIPKDKSHWYWRYIYYATEDGLDCCSDLAISFHYIQPSFFYVLDYFVYRLRPFGISHAYNTLPQKQNMTSLLQKWNSEISDNEN
ncbi:glycoprotein-N-acetylgalactosamine 3-beta-galactosyltransferase 1-like [Teleopsis dalmanni]|uniref:glycoprotein-N-acetylgalactosamine 3-beta-galactosyltransferase 1-like n=1 Tax=Teleopsis dalmanni TaxID=139649 RepID=UPI000D32C00E|nr:glycoprotein-N-acetylgalactosamine 3-beta-galactosyltransferase 1-like [Teleopsis dalmanni]